LTAGKPSEVGKGKEPVPYSLYIDCPECGEETLHKVLKGKVFTSGAEVRVDATVKCSGCGHVHGASVRESKPIDVPIVVSWLGKSERTKLQLDPGSPVTVGDIIQQEFPLLVTAIETKLRRVESAKPSEVVTLWAKRYDKVRVPFSISSGRHVRSVHIEAVPEEEFCCGDVMEFDRGSAVITAIKTKTKNLDRGCAEAGDIVRAYCKPIRQSRR